MNNTNSGLNFYVTSMPASRPADYHLGCLDGSVFLDFDDYSEGRISLKRISFDGYGCCTLSEQALPMNKDAADIFKKIVKDNIPNQAELENIVKKTLKDNKHLIWKDALSEYSLA